MSIFQSFSKQMLLIALTILMLVANATAMEVTIDYNPYQYSGNWYKGQMHMHTTNSDGDSDPTTVANYYKNLGYDFIAITDHNYITPDPNVGILVLGSEYGKGSEENTADTGHILAINVSTVTDVNLSLQERIDSIVSQNGIAIVPHPTVTYGIPYDQLVNLERYVGIEIYNAKADAYAVDWWDSLLSTGKRVWGFAHDDEHVLTSDAGKTAIYVLADNLSTKAIINAIKRGSFYSVIGNITIDEINVTDSSITITASNASYIKFIGRYGQVLKNVSGTTATYQFTGYERYVRAEVVSADGDIAWTQPIFVSIKSNIAEEIWEESMSFPITKTPTKHAQYKIVINGTTWELYNATGSLEVSGTNENFWNVVQPDGDDIRVTDESYNELFHYVESWDYTNKIAVIWIRVEANVTELNIVYGNSTATKSELNNASMVFEWFDDFSTDPATKYTEHGGTGVFTWDSANETLKASVTTNADYFYIANGYIFTDGIITAKIISGTNGGFVIRFKDTQNWIIVIFRDSSHSVCPETASVYKSVDGSATELTRTDISNPAGSEHTVKIIVSGNLLTVYWDGSEIISNLDLGSDISSGGVGFYQYSGTGYRDDFGVLKLTDPADFGTPVVKALQKKFGTKTVYVNVTYLDTNTTERYNPTAYYKLEDKPQINVTSQLSVSGVNTTYGANISIELIDFVTLDKVLYNGTDVTANLTYQGTITNSTTGYTYNVYNFTTYEDGTLEIYGHVGNKAYEATFKLDRETVDIFNVTAVVGEALEITLPHRGNVTLASIEHTGVTSAIINTKDVGVGAKTLTITIDDPENFTVGYIYRTVNIDWGKIYFNVTDLQNKTLARTTYGFFNKNFSIISTDPTKLYAGDIEIDVYFHGVKLKSLEIYLNHTNNGLTLNISVNATQFKDYRNVTRIIASPNYFEVVNLSTKYPFSVTKLVNVSETVVVDYINNAPTSVKVEGATSYTYEKPVLKITASGNVTITDLYKLTVPLRDRLGNKVNFYVLINGSRVDASDGVVSKLLRPSWYEVKVPITVSGFELWKFNNSSNIALVEISTSDKTLPTAEYRVPSKIESKEVRLQRLSLPFLSSKPAQEEIPIVRLEGTLRDFYNAPVANKPIIIEVASPNYTRIYNVTTDSSGNFRVDVDMARGVEYKVTYKFAGDDTYVGTSTTKTFTIEQLLPAPPEVEIENLLILAGVVLGLVAVVAGAIYLARRTKAKALARMESEFRFFRRLK